MTIVVGDVNSTIACALVASKLNVRVAHVEAGLRSFDRTMPEEINRVLTDQLSDLLFVTESSAVENLAREGVAPEKVHFVGNVMIDTRLQQHERARALDIPARFGLAARGYAVLTLHRPSNVDDDGSFEKLFVALAEIGRDVPIVFPVHPRTRSAVSRSPAAASMIASGALRLLEPMGYVEFLGLVADSRVVLTDSGGIQEETTVLGVPCLTLRETTERPVTILEGTNRLVGTDPDRILRGWDDVKRDSRPRAVPALWDGGAAERIVGVLRREAEAHRGVQQEPAPLREAAFQAAGARS
jgi:UDP-N-acetylglucosamine 2-epimerase (non-hydrolysing)